MQPALKKPSQLYAAYVFDLDGTVYLGDQLLPSAAATISALRTAGKRTIFLSNNPTHTRADYAAKLTRLGLATPVEDIINSSLVMVDFLKRELPDGRLFVIGEDPLQNELRSAGFELTDDIRRIDAVIASFDRTFAYWKLQLAFDAIKGGARFFATNADRYCPVPGGGEPDCGAIIAAIEACTDTGIEAVVGKPSVHTTEAILNLLALPPENCIMVGDRLETDIKLGLNAGMASALVLSGVTSEADLATTTIHPTYILRGIGDLLPEDCHSGPD